MSIERMTDPALREEYLECLRNFRLMHDFLCNDHKDMHYDVLAERVRYYKENERGVAAMCEAVERLCKKVAVEATAEAIKAEKVRTARYMLNSGKFGYEEVSRYTELPVAVIRELSQQEPA